MPPTETAVLSSSRPIILPLGLRGWKCHRCKRYRSVRRGSFFEGSRLSLQQHVQFLWKWSQRDSLRVMSLEGIATRKTLVKLARNCREVAWHALILHPIPMLGDPGVIVQIDESKFNHKSKVCRRKFYDAYRHTKLTHLKTSDCYNKV